MVRFEKFRPQLKPGKITPQGEKIIFETESPLDQIVLPIEVLDFLLLCNGEHAVGDIIETLYHRKGAVPFKVIYRTLTYLKTRGFLENGEELDDQSPDKKHEMQFLTFKPLFEISIGKRIFNETDRPLLFYIFSMVSIIAAILSLQWFSTTWLKLGFLNISSSFWSGFVFLFVGASILLSFKNFFKCLLLLFLTGRAYNFCLTANGFSVYFRVKSDSLFLVSNKLYLLLFHLAVNLCYFPIVAAVYFFFPDLPFLNEAMGLALVLFLFELNPFQESEVSYLIRSFSNDDTLHKVSSYMINRPILSLIHPFERNRQTNLYLFYTHFALIWSGLVLTTTLFALGFHFNHFIAAIKSAPLLEQLSALTLSSYLLMFGFVASYNVIKLIYLSLLLPISHTIQNSVRKKQSYRLQFFNSKEVIKTIEPLPLFTYFSAELLGMIVNRSELKQYKKGTPVILQGDDGTHLYVLLSGALQVRKRQPSGRIKVISELHPTSIFGEIAVIEETKRMAEVIAIDDSIVLEVPARMLRQMAQESQYIRELDSFRNAIMVNQFFSSAPLFRELNENLVLMFITKGKIESYLPDQIVFKQGENGDGFYLILRGAVGVSVNGRPVTKIQQGGFFGEISMIADVPRTGSVYALEPTQTLKISRDVFWEILSLDINMAMFIESVGEMRIREDIEIIKAGAARVA